MQTHKIRKVLDDVSRKKVDVDDALQKLKFLPFEDLGFAKIDHHRALRKGFPEVVFCQNKTIEQVVGIVKKLAYNNADVIATRASPEMFDELKKQVKNAKYNKISKTIVISKNKIKNRGKIIVESAARQT